ncbi:MULTISPECIES: hypothetical protein [unclassified Nostoc]|nr:hypothetical protein [Nostoc sp. JL23]
MEIFAYIYPDIKDFRFGILHKVLYIILDTEHQQAKSLCNIFGIAESGTKYDDEQIIDSLINNTTRTLSNPISIFESNKRELFWIVAVACILVGAIGCIQFIQRRKNKQRGGNARKVQQPVAISLQPSAPTRQSLTVVLCLIVPAHIVNTLKE